MTFQDVMLWMMQANPEELQSLSKLFTLLTELGELRQFQLKQHVADIRAARVRHERRQAKGKLAPAAGYEPKTKFMQRWWRVLNASMVALTPQQLAREAGNPKRWKAISSQLTSLTKRGVVHRRRLAGAKTRAYSYSARPL